jgi:hypothetical protein
MMNTQNMISQLKIQLQNHLQILPKNQPNANSEMLIEVGPSAAPQCEGSEPRFCKNEARDKDCARTPALVHSKSLPLESLSSFVDILIIVTRPCSVATLTRSMTQRATGATLQCSTYSTVSTALQSCIQRTRATCPETTSSTHTTGASTMLRCSKEQFEGAGTYWSPVVGRRWDCERVFEAAKMLANIMNPSRR